MDYKAFYAEIAEWIIQVNRMAAQHGMESDPFWKWVTISIGEIANKYGNNPLVVKQMTMLFTWLDDIYADMRKKKN